MLYCKITGLAVFELLYSISYGVLSVSKIVSVYFGLHEVKVTSFILRTVYFIMRAVLFYHEGIHICFFKKILALEKS